MVICLVLIFIAISSVVASAAYMGDRMGAMSGSGMITKPGTSGPTTNNGVGCGDIISAAQSYLNLGIGYSKINHCGPNTIGPSGVTAIDCSGYVSRALRDAGDLPPTACLSTGTIVTSSYFDKIAGDVSTARSVMQPGDVLVFSVGDPHNAHTVIYGGSSGSTDTIYESGGHGGGPHVSDYNVFSGRQLSGVYRNQGCVSAPTPVTNQ